MNKKIIAIIMTLSLALLISGCSDPKEKVLVKINDANITAYDLSQYVPIYGMTIGVDVTAITDKAKLAELEATALDDLVAMEVIKQYYSEKGQNVIPETKDADLETFMTQVNSDTATKQFLKDNKITDEYLQNFFLNQYYTTAFFADVNSEIKDPTGEAKKYYDAHIADYSTEQVLASHILVKTKAEAEAIMKELVAGADFAEIAKAKSIDTGSGANGGDLGYFKKDAMVAPFAEASFSTEPGQLSGIVESEFGFHIIKVFDKKTVATTFEEEQQNILYKIFDTAYKNRIEEIKKTMDIEKF
jgi:foldase protein PrsA